MNGIVTLSLVPLRATASEAGEMTSQLLFGERVEILEVQKSWLMVRNLSDLYIGWADRKMIRILTPEEEQEFSVAVSSLVKEPFTLCTKMPSKEQLILPGGSILHNYINGQTSVSDEVFMVNNFDVCTSERSCSDKLLHTAQKFLNAPYLWGGKSILGIDCSGFVQVVYSISGIQLPRDASQQVEAGHVVDFLSEAKAGDLAFFENAEAKIIHVGILLNSSQIIHASGWVKIENIDSQGIISTQTGEYTHRLRVLKRILRND
jgi:cell wall-associated NlpC family hydrolase